jgi:hypothetical protein
LSSRVIELTIGVGGMWDLACLFHS